MTVIVRIFLFYVSYLNLSEITVLIFIKKYYMDLRKKKTAIKHQSKNIEAVTAIVKIKISKSQLVSSEYKNCLVTAYCKVATTFSAISCFADVPESTTF